MNYNAEFERWLVSSFLTEEERAELLSIKDNEELKAFRFSSPMDFGTAGLRSTIYMGIGCMNRFTVAQTTRGIAALVKAGGGENRGVCIACDSRNHSAEFARVSAAVLASEGIKVYIFDNLRPTPELSFAYDSSIEYGANISKILNTLDITPIEDEYEDENE